MRIGIFSGSFDPIHTGHAMIANYAAQWEGLDEVWLIVSPLNPLKEGSLPAPDVDRLAMADMVAKKCGNVRVSDFEFGMPLPSYTYRTLTSLAKSYPDDEFILVIGSDNWINFEEWRDYDRIIEEFRILIYPRPGYAVDKDCLPASVSLMEEAPQALISSSFIRESVKEGKNLNFFLPPEVFEYIKKKRLYERG